MGAEGSVLGGRRGRDERASSRCEVRQTTVRRGAEVECVGVELAGAEAEPAGGAEVEPAGGAEPAGAELAGAEVEPAGAGIELAGGAEVEPAGGAEVEPAGAHEEVLRHAGRALEIETRQHGAAHPILAPTLELLARSALELGRNDEAAATIRRALALSRPSVIGRHAHGAVLLSAAWIGRATGVTPAEVRRLADEAATFLGDRAEPDQRRELDALRAE